MRAWLIVLLFLPLAGAEVVTDAEGDAYYYVAGQSSGQSTERAGPADLVALDIEETKVDMTFVLTVGDVADDARVALVEDLRYDIGFWHDGLEFTLQIWQAGHEDGSVSRGAHLLARGGGGVGAEVRAEPSVTIDGDAYRVTIDRRALSGSSGAPPLLGSALKALRVDTYTLGLGNICAGTCTPVVQSKDRMPDDGEAVYTFVEGIEQDGDLSLTSTEPFRLSNGGAGTYVFSVVARNDADVPLAADLRVADVPSGWQVSLPAERAVLDAGAEETYPILVTTPSLHDHGTTESFVLSMEAGEHVGRIELGIRFMDVPQPTGHHSTVFLHARQSSEIILNELVDTALGQGTGTHAYMNALEEDARAADVGVPADGTAVAGLESSMRWQIPLEPGLGVGLDFDTSAPVTVEATLEYLYAARGVVLRGDLTLETDDASVVLGSLQPTPPVDLQPGEARTLTATMVLEPEADEVAHVTGQNLLLTLYAEGTWNGPLIGPAATPMLRGGYLDMPLLEYHDAVEAFYDASRLLKFSEPSLEAEVNPGEVVVFKTALRNGGTDTRTVRLNVTGVNDEWARILGAHEFDVGAGKDREIAVAVSVPDDTPDAALADLVLQARDAEDPHRIAVMDLVAVVDADADHPDHRGDIEALDAALQTEKKSPGPAIVVILAGILAIVRSRR